jgi:pilus assembly protein CpaC
MKKAQAILLSAAVALNTVWSSYPVHAQQAVRSAEAGVNRVPSPRLRTGGADTASARSIEMGVGRSIIVDLPRDAKEVFVGNPAVANAVVRSSRKLFVIGVATGATTIIALDGDGNQIAALEMQIGREPGLLQKTMKTALPQADIRAVSIGDSIVLTGTVDTVLEAQKAVDIAKGFVGMSAIAGQGVEGRVINSMSVRAKDQVMLKVTVAEVKRSALKQLGVNLTGSWSIAGNAVRGTTDNGFTASRVEPTSIVSAGAVNAAGEIVRGLNVKMLERHGVLRTLAEPNLTAISGETAKFVAGGEIPVPKTEESASGGFGILPSTKITVEYKPFGVMLDFTPTVLSEGRISISVNTEVTEIDAENSFRFNTTSVPAFRTRRAFTTVELPSGGSMVTAGLLQQVSRQALNGLPGLSNLPILGAMFRSRDYFREETELMIMVTPYITKPSKPGDQSRPDDGFVEATDPGATFMGRLNRVYGHAGAAPPSTYRGKVGFIHE